MTKTILILGASGTVGGAVFRKLSQCENLRVWGTYFSARPQDASAMVRFSLESPDAVASVLRQVQPDIIISALRGDFPQQLLAHEAAADFLAARGGKMIFLSTVNVFDGSVEKPHYETDSRIACSDYGRFKIQCEDLLQNRLGRQAAVVRLPFVWGRNSPRMRAVSAACKAGRLEVFDLWCNHASDLQIADLIAWMIQEDKSGIFHVGTSDVTRYQDFIERLIRAIGAEKPRFVQGDAVGFMAALNSRADIPQELMQWDSERLIQYLCAP